MSSSFSEGMSSFVQCFKGPAAELFTEHLKTNPEHFDSWMYRGTSYRILGLTSKAISDYATAEKYGSPCEKLVVQGLSLLTQDKFSGATALFKQATTSFPNDAIGWHHYGYIRCLPEFKYSDEAAFALRKAISLNYRFSGVTYYLLGKILISKGDRSAIDLFREGLRLNPTCTVMHIELGGALLEAGSSREAEKLLSKALELNDTLVEANRLLGKLFSLEGNDAEAAKHRSVFEKAALKQGANSGRDMGKGGDGSYDWESVRDETWKSIKKDSLTKARYRNITYYKIKDRRPDSDKFIWVSKDTAGHAGSGFKVWIEKGRKIVFDSSYDEKLQRIANKHDSNEGNEIAIQSMSIDFK